MGICSQKENLKNYRLKQKQDPRKKLSRSLMLTNYKYEFKSSVLTSKLQRSLMLKQIIPLIQKNMKGPLILQLVYKASSGHYLASKFHQATNQIQNTILLVKTTQGRIFGGYTPCQWRRDVMYQYQNDQRLRSFLFAFHIEINQTQNQSNSQIQKQKLGEQMTCQIYHIKDKQKAIMNHSLSGPVFGEGHDIYIADKCNLNDNWCNLGKSYQCNSPFGSNKANNALSGQSKFLIVEYQIWKMYQFKQNTQEVSSINYNQKQSKLSL